MTKPNYYAIIPAEVRYSKKLTPNAKLLYAEITALCNMNGKCTASSEYFCRLYEVSRVSIQKWLEISKINNGSLFRRFNKGSKLSEKRLTDQTVALLIKKYLEMAGINSKNYSGHSLRSGFATSAAESGAEERNIMAMTGHKSTEMVRRYIKEANLFKNNALNKIKI